MNCPRCTKPIDTGAAFCGNCGLPLTPPPASQPLPPQMSQAPQAAAQAPQYVPAPSFSASGMAGPQMQQAQPQQPVYQQGIPAYAAPTAAQHSQDTKALLSVILGAIGIPLSLVPIAGLGLGIAGVVLGSLSRGAAKKTLSTVGIVVSCLAILVSLGLWAFFLTQQDDKQAQQNRDQYSGTSVEASVIKTPCYTITFTNAMRTDSGEKQGCDMRAYEGQTIDTSNVVYKVYAHKVATINEGNFVQSAKAALEKDVSSTLPGFRITSQRSGQFAGSPAYYVHATDGKVAVVEAAVLKKSGDGFNLFSLVHAVAGETADFKDLEAQWRWN